MLTLFQSFVHDNDVKLRKYIIEELQLPLDDPLDHNHVAKHLFGPLIAKSHSLNGLYIILKIIGSMF